MMWLTPTRQSCQQDAEIVILAGTPLGERRRLNIDDLLLGVIFCLPLAALYVYGCQRSPGSGDMTELIIAANTLGIPHPTGYPVYTWLGRLFSFFNLGGIPFRISFMSAVFAFMTLLMTFLFVVREARRLHVDSSIVYLFGILAVTLLGLTHPFWHYARVAEVYSVNTFFVILLAYLFTAWLETAHNGYLYGSSLVLGICLGTHLSNIMIVPVFITMTWFASRQWRYLVRSALLVILGTLQYVYLLIRAMQSPPYLHPQAHFFDSLRWTGTDNPIYNWLWFITGGRWRGHYIESADRALFKFRELRDILNSNYTAAGVVLLTIGLALYILQRNRRKRALFLPILMLIQLVYFLGYEMSAPGMILPLFAFASIFICLGMSSLSDLIRRLLPTTYLRRYGSYAFTVIVGILLVHSSASRPQIDFSYLAVPPLWVNKIIDSLPADSTLDGMVWDYEKIVDYYRIVEDRKIPFRSAECDDGTIRQGKGFVLGTPRATERYRKMGYRLTPYAYAGEVVIAYQINASD
jgi:hypothetical protein